MKKKSTGVKECIFKVFYLLIYFWLCWVFAAVLGLSLVAANRGRLGAALPVVLRLLVLVATLVLEHRL